MELVKQKPSYEYWLAKGILLLGENFTASNDYFNAKHSLQSILDNYDGPEKDKVIQEAIEKLRYVNDLELKEQSNEPEQQDMEIEFNELEQENQKVQDSQKEENSNGNEQNIENDDNDE